MMSYMPRFIAVMGEKGAGKGVFTEIVKKRFPHVPIASVRFSDPLRDILTILNKETSRDNMQRLVTALREAFDHEGFLVPALKKRLESIDADVVILDGVRKKEEVEAVKEWGSVIVYITADQKVRFERRRQEAEKIDEQDMAWEQFVRQDTAPSEVSIRTLGEAFADVIVENKGTFEEFEQKIVDAVQSFMA